MMPCPGSCCDIGVTSEGRSHRPERAAATAPRRYPSAGRGVLQQPAVREAALVCPQHGGQLVLVTGGSGSAPADELAGRLAERGWPGDVVLAEQLLGRLLPLPHVQLDEVAMALDDQQGGVLDLESGETTLYAVLEALEEEADLDASDVVEVPGQGPAAAWQDRRVFVESLADERARDELGAALEGRGAFRRFSDRLDRWPELVPAFLTIRDERALGRARQWLADEGLLGPDEARS